MKARSTKIGVFSPRGGAFGGVKERVDGSLASRRALDLLGAGKGV